MEINLQNVEQIIFFDKSVQALLPEFRVQFDQWMFSYRIPGLKAHGQKAVLEVLNGLTLEHIKRLEEKFGQPILMERLNDKLVEHYNCNKDEADRLCEFAAYKEFCLYRDKDQISMTFWR
jgi:hypothetical protein